MSTVTVRPDGTTSSSGTSITGAASIHAALSDNSDSSYVTVPTISDQFRVELANATVPSGAWLKQVTIRARVARPDALASYVEVGATLGETKIPLSTAVTWTSPTTLVALAGGLDIDPWDASELDGLTVRVANPSKNLRVYELYADVMLVAKPITDVTAPTSPVSTTNRPVVGWSNTLDGDGGAQTHYEVRIFTDAVYLAGGFDPVSSSAASDSGIVVGSATTWQADNVLADDTYRAYVRVAQTVQGEIFWSDWDYLQFDLAVVAPNTPTLNATADNTNGRITLAVADGGGAALSSRYEFQRSIDGGTTWKGIRVLDDNAGTLKMPHVVAAGVLADGANATSHVVPLPAPSGGILASDLLVAFVAMDGNPTISWPAGWTEIKDEAGNGNAVRVASAWKRATGGETGTVTVTSSASEGGGARILCIRDAHITSPPEISTGISGSGANADPDSLNPSGWDIEPTLWIAAVGIDGNVAVTAAPANFLELGNTRWADATNGAGIATAVRLAAAASVDPGAFTHAAEDTRTFTVAVRPRNPSLTVWDYEAPEGVVVRYRARAAHSYEGGLAYSAWSTADIETWTSSTAWLKHPLLPAYNVPVPVLKLGQTQRAARQGIFQPLGASLPVVVADKRAGAVGAIDFRTDDAATRDALDALLDLAGHVVLIQHPASHGEPDRYVVLGDHGRDRFDGLRANAAYRIEPLGWVQVAEPTAPITSWA